VKRREFITLVGGAMAWPLAARAQQGERMRRIGVLMSLAETDPEAQARVAAFRKGLQTLGWAEGRNVRIDIRWAASDAALMQRFAKELIALQPDLIVSHNTPTTASLQQQTRTIPIVFVIVSDPVGSGFVASFPRPGGNITGFTNIEPTMAGRRTGAGPSICRPRSRTRGAVADILRRSTLVRRRLRMKVEASTAVLELLMRRKDRVVSKKLVEETVSARGSSIRCRRCNWPIQEPRPPRRRARCVSGDPAARACRNSVNGKLICIGQLVIMPYSIRGWACHCAGTARGLRALGCTWRHEQHGQGPLTNRPPRALRQF
jgi:hypothetical protein